MAFAGLLSAMTAGNASAAVPAAPPGWTTVFSDDFNGPAGTGLNTSDWLYDLGHNYNYPGAAPDWGTWEVESNTNSTANVYLDGNGHLAIKPIRDASGNWTSGRVETQRSDFAAPPGGMMEMSASIQQPNPTTGLGYWPAFWALGAGARPVGATNWPSIGEMDMMEDVNAVSQHSTTFHCDVWGGQCNDPDGISSDLQPCPGCQTGYHTYSVIVDRTNTAAEQLRFYLDGNLSYTVNENQVSTSVWQAAVDHGFMAIFDVAMGGSYPKKQYCGNDPTCTIDTVNSQLGSTTSGIPMNVDWFAVYEKDGSSSSSPSSTPSPSSSPSSSPSASPSPSSTSSTGSGAGSCPASATSTFPADCYASAQLGSAKVTTTTDSTPAGADGNQVAQLSDGAVLRYDNVNFGSTGSRQFRARVASGAAAGVSGLVNVVLDSPSNAPIGSFALGNTGGWNSWQTIPANITATTGTHTVYLEFKSGAASQPYASVHWFDFPAT
ncbi:carbohydrate-binding protein [Streptomyces puniciscabiei]